ncbi:MAG: hypothetical protein JRH19_18040 [Deltaproteobacteria bacterium]|nr:hypothetical protein [Deltaproteobacteria bacterium]
MKRWGNPALALALGLATAVLLLYVAELVLRLSISDPGLAAMEQAAAAGHPFDARSRMALVRELRARGIAAVPRIVPAALREESPEGVLRSRVSIGGRELLPLSGISRRPTVLCNESGQYAVYDSDEHGFRNPTGLWQGGSLELLLLGDSFTIGECVPPGASIGDQLRARIPATLNLGYSGNSPLLELATLVEYAPSVAPRRVLWFIFENDLAWFDLGKDRRTPLLMAYLDAGFSQGLMGLRPEIDRSLEALVDQTVGQPDDGGPVDRLEKLRGGPGRRLATFLRMQELRTLLGRLRAPASTGAQESPDYELLARILGEAKRKVESWDGELVVVYLPGVWKFYDAARAPAWGSGETRERLLAVVDSLGLRLVDVEGAMRRHDDPLSLYSYRGLSILGSPHMNVDGYAFAAKRVLEALYR